MLQRTQIHRSKKAAHRGKKRVARQKSALRKPVTAGSQNTSEPPKRGYKPLPPALRPDELNQKQHEKGYRRQENENFCCRRNPEKKPRDGQGLFAVFP